MSALGAHAQVTVDTIDEITVPRSGWVSAVIYYPDGFDTAEDASVPAVVMMHGCSGMWSFGDITATNGDDTPNLQNAIEKWGLKLASEGVVAIAVDSFTSRYTNWPRATMEEWQDQCAGSRTAGRVDPYTTRARDAGAAYDFLVDTMPQIDATRVGILGWSHGAQATLVTLADTVRGSGAATAPEDRRFAVGVVFYPGCGAALGFGEPDTSSWHPYADFRMNMGEADELYTHCDERMIAALDLDDDPGRISVDLAYDHYAGADHSFDGKSQSWPTTTSCTNQTDDVCAMRNADIDSLTFFLDRL